MQICERSLNNTQNGPSMPPSPHFVRAEILPSGYLIRPCEGGGSILHIVDHLDLEVHNLSSNVITFIPWYTRNLALGSESEVFPLFLSTFHTDHTSCLYISFVILSVVEICCSHGVCLKFFVLFMSLQRYSPKEPPWP